MMKNHFLVQVAAHGMTNQEGLLHTQVVEQSQQVGLSIKKSNVPGRERPCPRTSQASTRNCWATKGRLASHS